MATAGHFLERPSVGRDQIVLPDTVLENIERQVLGVSRHAGRLLASGQHLKRGILLHGAPGTGKTHTVRYLLGQLPEVTVIVISGRALGRIREACSVARALQPALASRPGRVDLAAELPLPDASARRRLIELYRGDLVLDLADEETLISRTEGVTASFLKELLRKAALLACEADSAGEGAIRVTDADLSVALDQLLDSRNQLTRVLLGGKSRRGLVVRPEGLRGHGSRLARRRIGRATGGARTPDCYHHQTRRP